MDGQTCQSFNDDPDGAVVRALGACCRLLRKTEGNGADVSLYRVDAGGADDGGRPAG